MIHCRIRKQLHENSSKLQLTVYKSISFVLLILMFFCFHTYGQSKKVLINKPKIKDSIFKNSSSAKVSFGNKIITDSTAIASNTKNITDSLTVASGKFSFYKKGAHASYYADKFHGRKTASGKRYDKNKLTAAHKKLPFGTILKVTNESNGKSVFVEVIDRGPFVRSREIDLSRKAFGAITGNKSSGFVLVTLEVLQKKKFI